MQSSGSEVTLPEVTPVTIRFLDDTHFELDGFTFEHGFRDDIESMPAVTPFVMKHRYQIECYEKVLAGHNARNVVELGIHRGGSAIFLDRLLRPRRLVAVDIAREPAPALTHYVETHNRIEALRAHYGVDQADKSRLSALLDDAFGEEQIDLVIDDASHFYTPTIASFEAIFPRLRPGGLYVVEDWDGFHQLSERIASALRDGGHTTRGGYAGYRARGTGAPQLDRDRARVGAASSGSHVLSRSCSRPLQRVAFARRAHGCSTLVARLLAA